MDQAREVQLRSFLEPASFCFMEVAVISSWMNFCSGKLSTLIPVCVAITSQYSL